MNMRLFALTLLSSFLCSGCLSVFSGTSSNNAYRIVCERPVDTEAYEGVVVSEPISVGRFRSSSFLDSRRIRMVDLATGRILRVPGGEFETSPADGLKDSLRRRLAASPFFSVTGDFSTMPEKCVNITCWMEDASVIRISEDEYEMRMNVVFRIYRNGNYVNRMSYSLSEEIADKADAKAAAAAFRTCSQKVLSDFEKDLLSLLNAGK